MSGLPRSPLPCHPVTNASTLADRGQRAYRVIEDLRTGQRLGITESTPTTLGSLMLPVMSVTGALPGWKRLLVLAGKRADDADQET